MHTDQADGSLPVPAGLLRHKRDSVPNREQGRLRLHRSTDQIGEAIGEQVHSVLLQNHLISQALEH